MQQYVLAFITYFFLCINRDSKYILALVLVLPWSTFKDERHLC